MDTIAKAFRIARNIDLRAFKPLLLPHIRFSDTDEIFCQYSNNRFACLFRYGVVAFYNFSAEQEKAFLQDIQPFCNEYTLTIRYQEEITVHTHAEAYLIAFDHIDIAGDPPDSIRLVLLYLAQSVALSYFSSLANELLNTTREHTNALEHKGKLAISGRNLRKYIGRVLNIKNRISENLYIFDIPETAWADESLDILNSDLKRMFDVHARYRSINEQVDIIKENLELFKDIMFQRQSHHMEWIIIILILIEVIDLFFLKFRV